MGASNLWRRFTFVSKSDIASGTNSENDGVKRGTFSVNVFAQVFSFIVSIGIGVMLTPYLIHKLGPAYYGLIPLSLTIISYCGILTVAINTSVSRSLIQAIERKEASQANLIFNTSVAVCISIAAIVATALVAATTFLDRLVLVPEDGLAQARWLFGCTAVSFVVSTLVTPFSVSAFCRNRFEITHAISITRNIVRVSMIVFLFWYTEPSLKSVGLAGLASVVVEAILLFLAWRHLLPEIYFRVSNVEWATFKGLFSTGVWVSVFQVGTILLLSIDLVLVNRIFGPASGGEYAAVLQWSALLRNFSMSLAAVFAPTIMALYGKGDFPAVAGYAIRASRFVGYCMSIPIAILCGLAPFVLSVWLGPEFAKLAPLMIVLVAPLSINLAVMPLFSISIAADKIKIPGILTIGSGVINLLLAIALATRTPLGILGVALSGVIVLTLKNAIFTPIYAASNIDHSWRTFLTPLIRLSLFAGMLAGAAWSASNIIVIDSWLHIISVSLSLAVVYSLLLYRFVMDQEDRLFVNGKIHTLASRFGLGLLWENLPSSVRRP